MPLEIIVALIGLLGVIIGAIPTYLFMRQKNLAEIEKLKAETEKIRAEAEKIRTEIKPTDTSNSSALLTKEAINDLSADKEGINYTRTKILFVAANPIDTVRLRLDYEAKTIEESLRTSPNSHIFELVTASSTQWGDLRKLLLRHNPDILHISGHSTKEGIVLEDVTGKGYLVPIESLDMLLSGFSDKIRLLIINTNESAGICKTLAQRIDFTIGISGYTSDKQAIEFTRAFYEAIASGKDIKTSFDIALASVKISEESSVGIYQLFNLRKRPERTYFVD